MLRVIVRRIVLWLFGGLGATVGLGVATEYVNKAIEQKGGFDDASRWLDAAMTAFSGFVLQPWFLCLAAASAGLAAGLWLDLLLKRREKPPGAAPGPPPGIVPTSCKIAFAPDGQPTGITVQNIKRWFVLHNLLIAVNKETGAEERHGLTNLFITFEDAVAIKQVHVRGQGAPVPRWEMKDRDPWQIVLAFNGPLAGVLLEVEVEV